MTSKSTYALAFALLTASLAPSFANANETVIPDYPQTDCTGPACATITRDSQVERISVYYVPTHSASPLANPSMGALLDNKQLQVEVTNGRGGLIFHVDVPAGSHGDFAVYFFDEKGAYDSDRGGNYHFSLK